MSVLTVTEDLLVGGWQCEGCKAEFKVGDTVYGLVISQEYGKDPYGLNSLSNGGTDSDYDFSSGHTEDTWMCVLCFVARADQHERNE